MTNTILILLITCAIVRSRHISADDTKLLQLARLLEGAGNDDYFSGDDDTTTPPVQNIDCSKLNNDVSVNNRPRCGRRQDNSSKRRYINLLKSYRVRSPEWKIVNGQEANVAEFPWVVALMDRNSDGSAGSLFCGGSLIRNRWVLTAAHCVSDLISTSQLLVRVGEHDFTSNTEKHIDVGVKRIISHPQYDEDEILHDIALLHLEDGVRISSGDHINTLCLERGPFPVGTECVVAGWGTTVVDGSVSAALRRGTVYIRKDDECTNPLQCTQLCASGQGNDQVADSCQGDSGGALFCRRGGNSMSPRWVQTGIVSYGTECGLAQHPGVYTSVHQYIGWIYSHFKKEQ